MYLTELPAQLAEVLIGLVGPEVSTTETLPHMVRPVVSDDIEQWERRIEETVIADQSVPNTDRIAIVRARRGQGIFRKRANRIESRCRITDN